MRLPSESQERKRIFTAARTRLPWKRYCGYESHAERLHRRRPGVHHLRLHRPLDPFSNCLFLFCGRRRDRIKALYWEGNGFVLLYKRLESGSFQWPRKESEARSLTPQQYRWLMEGLSVDQPKAHKPVSGLEIV
ncbi:MAG: IS66 family insertion sequence element accessory protein TnpB [Oscillospiraceae bacterium]